MASQYFVKIAGFEKWVYPARQDGLSAGYFLLLQKMG